MWVVWEQSRGDEDHGEEDKALQDGGVDPGENQMQSHGVPCAPGAAGQGRWTPGVQERREEHGAQGVQEMGEGRQGR